MVPDIYTKLCFCIFLVKTCPGLNELTLMAINLLLHKFLYRPQNRKFKGKLLESFLIFTVLQ